jgi:hypothetical protein
MGRNRYWIPGYGIHANATLPGFASGLNLEFSDIHPGSRTGTWEITLTYTRADQTTISMNRGIKIHDLGNGKYSFDINWSKVAGWLHHDVGVPQKNAQLVVDTLKPKFIDKAQKHIDQLKADGII